MLVALNKDRWVYFLIRILTAPFAWMPYSWIHAIGKGAGLVAYYAMRDYRKRTLSNLALAKDLFLSPKELIRVAKKSFQNLAINCLEYPKLAADAHLSDAIRCENPETAETIHSQGKGILFFCGHQANWEVLFLDGTARMRGIAIGKPIKNKFLYHWVLKIREKNGGKIIAQRNAVREGLRALRKGIFMGIVGDQGMPDSGYSFPFLGRRAWTSTAPALLAYKTNSPILFAETRRVRGGYRIRYSDPIWPDLSKPLEEDAVRMMDQCLTLLQESIRKSPGEWLWQHNRWKQQTPQVVYKRFRHDCICIILPKEKTNLDALLPHLPTLKQIYPLSFLTFLVPDACKQNLSINDAEIQTYSELSETLLDDFRFKLIFNFADYKPLFRHYFKRSAFEILTLSDLKQLADPHLPFDKKDDFSEIFKRALCRSGTLWTK